MPTVRELLSRWNFSVDTKPLEALDRSIADVKRTVNLVGAAVVGAAAGLFGLAEASRRYVDDLSETAAAVGLNTQFLAEMTAAASLGGASMQDVATGANKLQMALYDASTGGKAAVDALREIGISVAEAKKLSPEALFMKVGVALGGMGDSAKRAALTQQLLGRGGRKLLPAFAEGAEGLAKLGAEAREFGLVPGPEAIKAADEMEKSMARAKGVVKGLGLQIGTALMPVVSDVASRFGEWARTHREVIASKIQAFVKGLTAVVRVAWKAAGLFVGALIDMAKWLGEHPRILSLVKAGIAAVLAAMVVSKVMQFVGAIKAVVQVIKLAGLALAANPLMLAAMAIAAAAVLVIENWDKVGPAFEAVGEAIMTVLRPIKDWIYTYLIEPLEKVINIVPGGDKITGGLKSVDRLREQVDAAGSTSHSPGRPGSPESLLTPDWMSTGLLYNPPLAAAMGQGGGGGRSASLSIGTIAVNVSGSSASAGDIAGEVRRTVRQEWDAIAREAALDVVG